MFSRLRRLRMLIDPFSAGRLPIQNGGVAAKPGGVWDGKAEPYRTGKRRSRGRAMSL